MFKFRHAAAPVLAAAGVALGVLSLSTSAASAATSASTAVSNRPDGGHGTPAIWADDTFTRTLTVNVDATDTNCGPVTPAGDSCYAVTLSDHGTFTTRPGAGAPNVNSPHVGAALSITSPAVTGNFSGGYTQHVFSDNAPDSSLVPASEDDHGVSTGTGFHSTENWYKQAFPASTSFGTVQDGAYSWTYDTSGCETWVDSSSNNDGNSVGDGNITGKVCVTTPPPPPVIGPGQVSTFSNHSVSCLDNTGGHLAAFNPLEIWRCNGNNNQQWKLVPIGNSGTYQMKLAANDHWCVTAPNGTGRVVLGVCAAAPRQTITPVHGAGACHCGVYYRFPTAFDGGRVLDDAAFNTSNGAKVIVYPFNGQRNQAWSLP
jgi:hypothetical protein